MYNTLNKQDLFDEIITEYKKIIWDIETKARENKKRAYGGIIRASKGGLVEYIARTLIKGCWEIELGQDIDRLSIDSSKYKVYINQDYVDSIENEHIRKEINKNIEDYYYNISIDVQVYVDQDFIFAVECKSYTENAMLKRILYDMSLLRRATGLNNFALLQLESQLGGDYSELKENPIGSTSTRTLLSYYEIEPSIITLLEGERKVKKPIHKNGYRKKLEPETLNQAMSVLKKHLYDFV